MSSNSVQLQVIDSARVSKKLSTILIKQQNQKINKTDKKTYRDPYEKLKKNSTKLFNQTLYSDDHFKLQQIKPTQQHQRKITICRLKDILLPGTSLFGQEILQNNQTNAPTNLPHHPSFISQLHILPFWHYETLIQPKRVNQEGYYHVVVWKDGRLVKQTIDDTFYYDDTFKKIYSEWPYFKDYVWMHILVKVWAKCHGGYNHLQHAQIFSFINTFSYPDWKIVNPALQDIQQLISNMNPISKGELLAIGQTKNDVNVGIFGLVPNSASYIITGHQMEFQAIFVRVKALNGTRWNGLHSVDNSPELDETVKLQQGEFIMPLKQFTNLFHLIHITANKFDTQQDIYYTRYTLNLDARESKAKMILLSVQSPSTTTESTMEKQPKQLTYMTNLTIYFPSVHAYDLNKQRNQNDNNQDYKIPYCKLMIGKQDETTNLEASFVESMKEKMLDNEDGDFLYGKSSMQYEWIQGTYFKGYDNSCTFLMKLKPGRYYLRFKMETLRVEYRANINIVSSTHVKIVDPKMDKKEQQQFLTEILSSKARLQKRNIGYLNPIKKGSWYICNDDFQSIGYGYLQIQTTKASEYKIQLKVDPKMLKTQGYRLKSKKDQNKFSIMLMDGEGYTLVLKVEDGFEDEKIRLWPPQGIQITRLWRK